MFNRRKPASANAEKLTSEARSFETSIADLARKSERRAWWVAAAASVLALLLGVGYIAVMPLKREVPYLVLADPYRGTSTVARLEGLSPAYTANEFLTKSNVANFVIARESFEWDISPRRDRRLVYSMATGPALAEYRALYSPTNPDSPVKVYGPNQSIRIKILSIVLQGQTAEQPPNTAHVRFERWVFNRNTAESRFLDTRIATMKIGYDKNLQMNEEGRYLNPLGFRVSAYRTDPDSFGVQTSANPPSAPAMPVASAPLGVTAPPAPARPRVPAAPPAEASEPVELPVPPVPPAPAEAQPADAASAPR